MWITADISGCAFDTVDCYHNCDGCGLKTKKILICWHGYCMYNK